MKSKQFLNFSVLLIATLLPAASCYAQQNAAQAAERQAEIDGDQAQANMQSAAQDAAEDAAVDGVDAPEIAGDAAEIAVDRQEEINAEEREADGGE